MDDVHFDDNDLAFALKALDASKRTYMLDPLKAKTFMAVYSDIKHLLDESEAEYTINVLLEPLLKKNVAIEVLTDTLTVAYDSIPIYKSIVDEVIEITQHPTGDGRVKIIFAIKDVYIQIDN